MSQWPDGHFTIRFGRSHSVGTLPTGQTQLFIGLHLIHEITTAPAFDMLREKGMDVAFRERTFATVDHIVPTDIRKRPFLDPKPKSSLKRSRKTSHNSAWNFSAWTA